MHFTLSSLASATLFSSFLLSANARVLLPNVAKFLARKDKLHEKRQLCTSDIYASVLGDPQYSTDIIPFCSSFISIQPITQTATVTPRTTVFSTLTSIFGTVVETVTVQDPGTVTATAIQTDYVAKLKGREADVAARAVTTPAPILDLISGRLQRRQGGDVASSITSALSSACSCLHIPPAIVLTTTDAATVTKSEVVIDYEPTTEDRTVAVPTNTVTTTIETTIHTGSTSTETGTTSTDTSTETTSTDTSSPSTSTDTSSPSTSTDTSSPSTSTDTSSPSTSTDTSSPSTSTDTSSPSTSTETATETTTTATSTPTPSPTCPGNGTIIMKDCYNFQVECGIDYPMGDSYDLSFFVPTIDECIGICTDANAGVATPCLGISYLPDVTRGMVNCYIRQSLADPDYNPSYDVISAILLNPNDTCSTTSTPAMPSTSPPSNSTTSTVSGSPTMSYNATTTPSFTPTMSSNSSSTPSTMPTMSDNSTTSASFTPTISSNSSSTPSMMPTIWSNSSSTPSMTPTISMNSTTVTMSNMTTTTCPLCIPITFTAPMETITVYGNTTTVTVTKSRRRHSAPTA